MLPNFCCKIQLLRFQNSKRIIIITVTMLVAIKIINMHLNYLKPVIKFKEKIHCLLQHTVQTTKSRLFGTEASRSLQRALCLRVVI